MKNEQSNQNPCDIHGGLIADEMGLGKTIQMLGTIICNFKPQTLIILPLALIDQWEKTIIQTMGHHPLVYHGAKKNEISLQELKSKPIIISTYGLISASRNGKKQSLLQEIHWDRIIFDEAHHMRNKSTRIHKGALNLKSEIKWLVTGTPIQNRKDDFYSLCAIMGLPAKYYTTERNLLELVRHFIMKRTKKQANLQLPQMRSKINTIPWKNEKEETLAEDIHAMLKFSMVNKRQVDNMVNYLGSGQLAMLVRARQACVYPKLMKKHIEKLIKDGIFEDTKEILDACDHSSKIDSIVDLIIKRKDNKRAKLIFCHYRGEIDILAERLAEAGMKIQTFDGRTSHSERNNILTDTTLDALILQIQTGCEGLNLQHFSEIYFASPHWNPAVEDQAVARCHRIGQESEIDVFRFEMGGFNEDDETRSIDSYCADVQDAKRGTATLLDECQKKNPKYPTKLKNQLKKRH